jgi:hypothetical protein
VSYDGYRNRATYWVCVWLLNDADVYYKAQDAARADGEGAALRALVTGLLFAPAVRLRLPPATGQTIASVTYNLSRGEFDRDVDWSEVRESLLDL